MHRFVGPLARKTEIAPGSHRRTAALAIHTVDRIELAQGETADRIVLVHECDNCVPAVARLVTAGHDIDAGRLVSLHFLEGCDLERPDLAAHERQVAGAGVERPNGRGSTGQPILELDPGMVLEETLLPVLDDRLDEIETAS